MNCAAHRADKICRLRPQNEDCVSREFEGVASVFGYVSKHERKILIELLGYVLTPSWSVFLRHSLAELCETFDVREETHRFQFPLPRRPRRAAPAAAGSQSGEKPKVSTEQVAFAAIMRGIYW